LSAQEIFSKLKDEFDIVGAQGVHRLELKGLSVSIEESDGVGRALESWLGKWLENNNIYYDTPDSTQEPPDYILSDQNPKKHFLEVKAFRSTSSPGFDLANFEAFCDSLLKSPHRLDADYLIFAYSLEGSQITIDDIWLKKIWEITGSSSNWPLKVQDKRGTIYNIRPVTWYSDHSASTPPFDSKQEFVETVYQTLVEYNGQEKSGWFDEVRQAYNTYRERIGKGDLIREL